MKSNEIQQIQFRLYSNNFLCNRLAERNAFQTTGIATIRLRFSGFSTTKVKPEDATNKIQLVLGETTGKQLKERIAVTVSSPENGLKIICAGKVLEDNATLALQNVKNGSQVGMNNNLPTDYAMNVKLF